MPKKTLVISNKTNAVNAILKELEKKKKISRTTLAKEINISKSSLDRFLNLEDDYLISNEDIEKIKKTLGIKEDIECSKTETNATACEKIETKQVLHSICDNILLGNLIPTTDNKRKIYLRVNNSVIENYIRDVSRIEADSTSLSVAIERSKELASNYDRVFFTVSSGLISWHDFFEMYLKKYYCYDVYIEDDYVEEELRKNMRVTEKKIKDAIKGYEIFIKAFPGKKIEYIKNNVENIKNLKTEFDLNSSIVFNMLKEIQGTDKDKHLELCLNALNCYFYYEREEGNTDYCIF